MNIRKIFFAESLSLSFFLLSGCAFYLPQSAVILKELPADFPKEVELKKVPFFPQEEYQCGPASLAMVIKDAGVQITDKELVDQVYLPARKGSLQVEMLAASRQHGLLAYELEPRLTDLLAEIAAGTPVVVLENYSYGLGPVWHYSVAIGFSLKDERIIRRSGKNAFESMPFAAFEYLWKSDGRWGMVVLPPGKIPATATESRYVKAVMALENSGQIESAYKSYKALLQRWPNSSLGLLGLGNTAYQLKNFDEALLAFSTLTLLDPTSVAALNNLAQTHAELGNLDSAVRAAEQAVSLGGPLVEISRATLNEIQIKISTSTLQAN